MNLQLIKLLTMKILVSDGFIGDFLQMCENNKTQILQKLDQKLE